MTSIVNNPENLYENIYEPKGGPDDSDGIVETLRGPNHRAYQIFQMIVNVVSIRKKRD
jgi:hypothetical protein